MIESFTLKAFSDDKFIVTPATGTVFLEWIKSNWNSLPRMDKSYRNKKKMLVDNIFLLSNSDKLKSYLS